MTLTEDSGVGWAKEGARDTDSGALGRPKRIRAKPRILAPFRMRGHARSARGQKVWEREAHPKAMRPMRD